jgi:fructokinase
MNKKILGIGNAIVDVLAKVDDKFLIERKLIKGSMKLINKSEFLDLEKNIKIEKIVAGGSVANTMSGIAYLKGTPSFIGKINSDSFGEIYKKSLEDINVKFPYLQKNENLSTGASIILITPDSERTMCTFLGIAGKINQQDIDELAIKQSELVFLEGYLWDEGEPKSAFSKAFKLANKTAMSLSDKFCVERHKESFLDLVKNKLDITFANEQEILHLIDANSFTEVIEFGKNLGKLLIVTRSAKGSIAIFNNEVFECESQKNLKLVDLTGAGDLFAAGFLHGYINEMSIQESLEKGTEMASKIIQKIGARLN